MQYQQQQHISQSKRKLDNQTNNTIEDPLIKLLTQSDYLESESPSECNQKLKKCKTEHTLQTKQFYNSNSFAINDQKFTFLAYEILEWETLQIALPIEIYQFLQHLKCQCFLGTINYTNEQLLSLINESQIKIKNQLEFLNKILDKGWIQKTIRIYNETTINFYALAIRNLTYESLIWIIKSLKKDLITPTERQVQSRIRDCYGLKYNKYEWEFIMNQLKSQKQVIKYHSLSGQQIELPMIQVINIKDPLINQDTQGIYVLHQNWFAEDEYNQDLDQKNEWNMFIEYLMEILNKEDFSNNKILKGGRSNCAQFIKLLGPKKLRELSLGRLTLFVQMAVDKNYIQYNKKVLVQDNIEKSDYTTDSSLDGESCNKLKIKELQEQLIELLLENQDGVSLGLIPTLLKERVNFEINLIELGFPKLSNFIETVKDVISIENVGKNNTVAKFNQSNKQLYKQQNESNNQKFYVYILQLIKNILSKHKYGISINQLYYDLSQLLGEWFNYQRFQCQSFFQFLQNYAENILVIVCQRGNQYLIYEKDLRFLPPPNNPNEINDQQFEYILSEAFQQSFGLSIPQSSFSNSWLAKVGDSQIRQKSLQRIEDSHQEIKDNLKFIDDILGNENKQNDTFSILDWSEKSMNPLGMISSINYGYSDIQSDFDLAKELQISLSQQQQTQQQEFKKK